MKKFKYYILKREIGRYTDKVRTLVSDEGDTLTLKLNDNVKSFDTSEVIGVPNFNKGDIVIPSEESYMRDDVFVSLGGNHKYTKVLRMSDCETITIANIKLQKIGSVYEKV